MGTNHYHRTNLCDCCGRYDQRHIGKSWSMFQGYRPDDWASDVPELLSWQQWKEHLLSGGTVWDEYGREVPVAEFIADVEAVPLERRRRQTQWIFDHGYGDEHDWHDSEGYSFCDREFS